jgi:histidinol dehydrogenase
LPLLGREKIARTSLADRGVILVAADLEEAIEVANAIAIEHLELMIGDPWAQVPHIRHAGAIFLGSNSPEAAGDYLAGPNHVLPTWAPPDCQPGRRDILKKSSLISYSAAALAADGEHIMHENRRAVPMRPPLRLGFRDDGRFPRAAGIRSRVAGHRPAARVD